MTSKNKKVMSFLFSPFKRTLREMKINKEMMEKLAQSDRKINIMPGFVTMNYMFFLIYAIFYTAIIYLLFASFFDVLSLLKLGLILLLVWYFSALHKNVYPKTRKNYLDRIGYDGENK